MSQINSIVQYSDDDSRQSVNERSKRTPVDSREALVLFEPVDDEEGEDTVPTTAIRKISELVPDIKNRVEGKEHIPLCWGKEVYMGTIVKISSKCC